jgi:hypothetical protein
MAENRARCVLTVCIRALCRGPSHPANQQRVECLATAGGIPAHCCAVSGRTQLVSSADLHIWSASFAAQRRTRRAHSTSLRVYVVVAAGAPLLGERALPQDAEEAFLPQRPSPGVDVRVHTTTGAPRNNSHSTTSERAIAPGTRHMRSKCTKTDGEARRQCAGKAMYLHAASATTRPREHPFPLPSRGRGRH